MPISFTPISEEGCWSGSTWAVDDDHALADMIARVALGQSRSVERILQATDALPPDYPTGGFLGAKALLSVEEGADPYHRDGWVFQVISWIAAHRQNADALIRAPQMIKADKGLDGLIIEFDDDDVAHVVICEEKATEHARQKVKGAVWPEFANFETGARDNELVASVTSLLERSGDSEPDKTVADILWRDTRAYRVAVTVGEGHSNSAGRKRLFKGYEKIVSGHVDRRRAETLFLDDIRAWIAEIATRAHAVVDEAEGLAYV
ncbi:MAG: hypothetical protein AAGD92_16115 [Pseudomonadota bacterium]